MCVCTRELCACVCPECCVYVLYAVCAVCRGCGTCIRHLPPPPLLPSQRLGGGVLGYSQSLWVGRGGLGLGYTWAWLVKRCFGLCRSTEKTDKQEKRGELGPEPVRWPRAGYCLGLGWASLGRARAGEGWDGGAWDGERRQGRPRPDAPGREAPLRPSTQGTGTQTRVCL